MPIYRSLISAAELQALCAGGVPCLLLDCGFDLADPTAGERAFADGHLPGAVYAHLDRDLSGALRAALPRLRKSDAGPGLF